MLQKEKDNSYYQKYIEQVWAEDAKPDLAILSEIFIGIEHGSISMHYCVDANWHCYEWLKKTIILWFRYAETNLDQRRDVIVRDKIHLAYEHNLEILNARNIRLVSGSIIRSGVYLGANVVVMPAVINIGAYIGKNTMIDMQAVIGSCAYVGSNCHISMNAGIGGVLEPLHAQATIVEDNCFVGAGAQIMDGVILRSRSLIAAGVVLTKSTKIYDRVSKKISYGIVPANAVVVPGHMPSVDNEPSTACAIITHYRNEHTNSKVQLNADLRAE